MPASKKHPKRRAKKRPQHKKADHVTSCNSATPSPPGPPQWELSTPLSANQQSILWLLEGKRDHDVADLLRAIYPDCKPDKVLAEVMAHFADIADADPKVIRGWCLEALQELYRRLMEIGEYPEALKVVKELYRVSS